MLNDFNEGKLIREKIYPTKKDKVRKEVLDAFAVVLNCERFLQMIVACGIIVKRKQKDFFDILWNMCVLFNLSIFVNDVFVFKEWNRKFF